MEHHAFAVLVVDNNDDVRDMLCDLFVFAGYTAHGATDGAAALQLLHADPTKFSLIILDLDMPTMDGWAFRDAQLADATIAAIPVIVLSANLLSDRRGLPTGIGRERFLAKPPNFQLLLEWVRHYCGQAQVDT